MEAKRILIPVGPLAQVWRDGQRQVVPRALCDAKKSEIVPFGRAHAEAAGILCTRTSDVVDASVVLIARQEGGVVATSDPDDLRRLDPTLSIEAV